MNDQNAKTQPPKHEADLKNLDANILAGDLCFQNTGDVMYQSYRNNATEKPNLTSKAITSRSQMKSSAKRREVICEIERFDYEECSRRSLCKATTWQARIGLWPEMVLGRRARLGEREPNWKVLLVGEKSTFKVTV